jgi:hypothetical protein
MLASAVFFFEVLEDGSIPLTHGEWLHGTFFRHLGRVNQALADELHEWGDGGGRPKPFCVSPLFSDEFALDHTTLRARRGASGWFRIGSLHAELSRTLESLPATGEP